eukprot:COSAG06_NODE_5049_length_3760_cov_3.135755_1_plen_252_part_00
MGSFSLGEQPHAGQQEQPRRLPGPQPQHDARRHPPLQSVGPDLEPAASRRSRFFLAVHSSDLDKAHHLCFFETGVIGGVSVHSDDSQSSAARLDGGVSLSFSRLCSFFGSWSRTQRGPAPRSPPRPRLFSRLEKTTKSEECTVSDMAAEGRHKFPSTLGTAVEERHKSLLVLVLYVCSIGSALAPPMAPSEGVPRESSRLAEAHGVEFALLGHTVGHTMYFRVFWQCTPQTLTKPIIWKMLNLGKCSTWAL